MKKIGVWALLSAVFLIGLLVGCGSSRVTNSNGNDESQVHNAELKIGDEAPDFRLPDHTGGYVRLSDYRGKSNVVLAFYPAAFTPV